MCIIAYKPKNQAFPSEQTLRTCFNNNPDGAGFMYSHGGVHIQKGFMTFDKFMKALNAVRKVHGDSIPYVLHFRISTQGGVRPDCTHPFPLSDKMERMRELKSSCKIGVAHNGIISLTSYCSGNVNYSDTMKFITEYLSLIIDSRDYYKNTNKVKLITKLAGSRLAILDNKGHCELIGDGWTKADGVWYSNSSYKPHECFTTGNIKPLYSHEIDDWETEYWEKIDSFYDPHRGLYKFSPISCPYTNYEDDTYCYECVNCEQCWSTSLLDDMSYPNTHCPYFKTLDERVCETCPNRNECSEY